jgi:hypothetical protein
VELYLRFTTHLNNVIFKLMHKFHIFYCFNPSFRQWSLWSLYSVLCPFSFIVHIFCLIFSSYVSILFYLISSTFSPFSVTYLSHFSRCIFFAVFSLCVPLHVLFSNFHTSSFAVTSLCHAPSPCLLPHLNLRIQLSKFLSLFTGFKQADNSKSTGEGGKW